MRDWFDDYKKVVVYAVIILLAILTLIILFNVCYELLKVIIDPENNLSDKHDLLQFIGNFLLIIVCLELIDTLAIYIRKHEFQVEAVLLVALTAVARELIVFDYETMDFAILMGIGLVIGAISVAYYLIKRMHLLADTQQEKVLDKL